MSLSDCEKCWNTPCVCGYNYRYLSSEIIKQIIMELQKILKARVDNNIETLEAENAALRALLPSDYELAVREAIDAAMEGEK